MSKGKQGCDCFSRVNAKLVAYNGILDFNLLASPPRAMLSISKLRTGERKKPPLMECSHCPFCGTKYPAPKNEIARPRIPAESYNVR